MYNLNSCLQIINCELELLKNDRNLPTELYEPIFYILNLGGKRIRPILTLMACNLFSDNINKAVKPALAVEVFHNFTLIHDDIMDHSLLRRNSTTVHKKWDENVAILSGDAMQIYAYKLLCETEMPLLENLIHIYNNTALEVCEGQQYDMNFGKVNNVSMKDYIRMIELKTAVLLAASLKIGAVCANASEVDSMNLYEFGRNLGLAFQIQDDYLDIYANQDIFGKTTGGDITENKKTFLLIKALEKANLDQSRILNQKAGNKISGSEKIEKVKKVFNDLDIPAITRSEINRYSDLAFDFLDLVNVEDSQKSELRLLANELTTRIK